MNIFEHLLDKNVNQDYSYTLSNQSSGSFR